MTTTAAYPNQVSQGFQHTRPAAMSHPLDWEYQTVPISQADAQGALVQWLRQGWELICVHRSPQQRNLAVAIMRRQPRTNQ